MAGKHAAPKPSPYSIAVGAVSYSLAITFAKHIPIDIVASAPAAITAAVAAVERGVADVAKVDPKLAADVQPVISRLAVQAENAASEVSKDVQAGVAAAPQVQADVKEAVAEVVKSPAAQGPVTITPVA